MLLEEQKRLKTVPLNQTRRGATLFFGSRRIKPKHKNCHGAFNISENTAHKLHKKGNLCEKEIMNILLLLFIQYTEGIDISGKFVLDRFLYENPFCSSIEDCEKHTGMIRLK